MLKLLLQKLFRRNSFLLKLLISIVSLICVPLIGIQLFMIVRSGNNFEQETTANYHRIVKSLAGFFDDHLQNLSISAVNVKYYDSLMQPLLDDVAGYDLSVIAQNMTHYGSTVPFADTIGIYYPNREMVLHSHYKYSVSGLSELFFSPDTSGCAALADFIQTADDLSLFYTGNYPDTLSQKLIVARSVNYNSSQNRKVVVFFSISGNTLLEWCSLFIPYTTGMAILDDNGSYIIKTDTFQDTLLTSPEYQAFLKDPELISLSLPGNENATILYKYQDSVTGRIFVVAIPRDTVQASITNYTHQTAGTLIFTIVLLVLLLSATLYINYKPVSRIISKYIEDDAQDSNLSDLEMIDSHFFALDQRINAQEDLLATFAMSDLLSGIRVSKAAAERYFTPDTYKYFLVAITSLPLTASQTNTVCRDLKELMPGKLIITTVPYRLETVFVYCSPEEINQAQLEDALQTVLTPLVEGKCLLHFGTAVSDAMKIQTSYNDAFLPEKLSLIPGGEPDDSYPSGMIRSFIHQLCSGNIPQALLTLDHLEEALTTLKSASRRFVNQKLLYGYLSSLQKNGISLPESEIDQMLAFPNSTILFKMLRQSVSAANNLETTQPTSDIRQMEKKLLTFVDTNLLSSNLCLSAAADHMQTSIYTVSRIFKESTGIGFKEYITAKRLQHACLLLRTTSLSVTAIASRCGFENANYFTVVFRTEYGIPPSKYRTEANASQDSPIADSSL